MLGQLFVISNLAAWAKAMKRDARKKLMDRFLKRFILKVRKIVVCGYVYKEIGMGLYRVWDWLLAGVENLQCDWVMD